MVGAHRKIPSTSTHPLTPVPPPPPIFEAEIFMRKYPLGPQHPKVLVGDGELNQQERMTAPATCLRFIERDIRTMRNSGSCTHCQQPCDVCLGFSLPHPQVHAEPARVRAPQLRPRQAGRSAAADQDRRPLQDEHGHSAVRHY